jgi:hypothetical protein
LASHGWRRKEWNPLKVMSVNTRTAVTSSPLSEWNALDFANRLLLGEFEYNLQEHLARLSP